jgi:hypothetical protein
MTDMTEADLADSYDPGDFEDTPESEWPGKVRRRIDGPDRPLYRALRAKFRRQRSAKRAPCHICNELIYYGLKHGDPRAWELDHYIPVSDPVDGERLALEPSNFRASHALCNRRRAALLVDDDDELGVPSEDWDTTLLP